MGTLLSFSRPTSCLLKEINKNRTMFLGHFLILTWIMMSLEASPTGNAPEVFKLFYNNSDLPPCQSDVVLYCTVVQIDWRAFEDPKAGEKITLPNGAVMEQDVTDDDDNNDHSKSESLSMHYISDNDDEGELTININKKTLFGHFEMANGDDFSIESFTSKYYLWIKYNQSKFNETDIMIADVPSFNGQLADTNDQRVVTFTVTVYYTSKLDEDTDVPTFVDQVIAETNQGYRNSKVPIRVKLHCLIKSDIRDGQGIEYTLEQLAFKHGKNSAGYNKVRKSADAAILIGVEFEGAWGLNYFDTLRNGLTIGVVVKQAALGYYSFGHEMGHGFGLTHNREVSKSSSSNYAFGHIIKVGKYRSILAYDYKGEKRVNYYSNPNVKYKGYATGRSGKANNARVLTERRYKIADVGNEQMTCPNGHGGSSGVIKINGGWSSWSKCSVTCGAGTRSRKCTNPPPSNGGADCYGRNRESCNEPACRSSGACENKKDSWSFCSTSYCYDYKKYCEKTCCCVDTSTSCSSYKHRCSSSKYVQMVCKETCDLC